MTSNTPNPAFSNLLNSAAFEGTTESDFYRLGPLPDSVKKSMINYSAQDFAEIKESLVNYVKAVYPDDYNSFAESDLGMMFLELVAYMGSVMSFKADAVAQEMYLPTAKSSNSIRKLLELIGVTLKGPNSSKASCSLVLQDTAQAVSGSYKLTIPSSNRTVNSTSTRDGLPLSYTAYKTDANGDIDFTQTTLELEKGDSAGSLGITYPLIFLEGMLQQHSGNFSQVPTAQTVYVPFPSIIEGAVSVSSTDGIWSEIDSLFFASGADHKVFEKRYRDDYSVDLYFGDGIRSATPTVGTPYVVQFRTGGGERGDIPKQYISSTIKGTSNDPSFSGEGNISCTLSNPTAGTGGFNAESPDLAKRYGPQWFASQYRCVTGEDYTSFANRYITDQGQTGKALSVLRDNGGAGNMIDIYLLTRASNNQLERSNYPFKSGLLEYLNKYRMLTDELTIVDGLVRTLDLVCTVYIDRDRKLNSQDIQARVSARIQKFFDISNMDFGTPVKFSDLTNYVLEDNAVRFFKVENYASDIFNNFNEIAQLNNFELNVQTV
tara:strand:+ start:163 stop:1803 length:1641 start_codon:yes stop_codon:yes gene_type:complete